MNICCVQKTLTEKSCLKNKNRLNILVFLFFSLCFLGLFCFVVKLYVANRISLNSE